MTGQIIFKHITPLFNFVQGDSEFAHSGNVNDTEYKIYIMKMSANAENFEEIIKFADPSIKNSLQSIHVSSTYLTTNYFLITEVFLPNIAKYKSSENTIECIQIYSTIIKALQLSTTSGIRIDKTYTYRYPFIQDLGSLGINGQNINDNPFKHNTEEISQFNYEHYSSCINVFNNLLDLESSNSQFSKIINLSLNYFTTTFKMQFTEHSFLILMSIFEAIFKIDYKDKTENAKKRIAKLLSSSEEEYIKIVDEFGSPTSNGYIGLRNKIVHGDISLNQEILRDSFDQLYFRMRIAIIKIITEGGCLKDVDDFYGKFIEKFGLTN